MGDMVRGARIRVGANVSSIALAALTLSVILFNLVAAFHGNIWFDESYSMALASHTLPEIIAIGATDVHPVLYYVMLRIIYLVFGPSVLAMRLFSVCGMVACVLLGWGVVRKDYGNVAAALFVALVSISPWAAAEAVDIRMYSWAAFFTGLSFLYSMRIVRVLLPLEVRPDATEVAVPRHWWVVAFAAALAAAYTHYFAAIASFMSMSLVLASAWLHARSGSSPAVDRAPLRFFWRGVGLCLLGYLPWIIVVIGQAAMVSRGFWIKLDFPNALLTLCTFPFTSEVTVDLMEGDGGGALACVCWAGAALAAACLLRAATCAWRSRVASPRMPGAMQDRLARALGSAVVQGVFVFFGTALLTLVVGLLLGQPIFMTRYMVCAFIPLSVSIAVLLACANKMWVPAGFAVGLILVSTGVQVRSCQIAYDERNAEPVAYYDQVTLDGAQGRLPVVAGRNLFGDIQAVGPLSVLVPEAKIEYLDAWLAYDAFTPTVTFLQHGAEALDGYVGRFVYLAGRLNESDIEQLEDEVGASVVSSRVFERPYRDTCWTIVLMERR